MRSNGMSRRSSLGLSGLAQSVALAAQTRTSYRNSASCHWREDPYIAKCITDQDDGGYSSRSRLRRVDASGQPSAASVGQPLCIPENTEKVT